MMKTILIVEDEAEILENNRRFFEDHGYTVQTAETVAEARIKFSQCKNDAVLLDIMLPDGNGLNLLTEWRAAGIKTPIIMLTAWGEPQDISRGYKLGATAYLSKPFDYEAILTVLEGIFHNAQKVTEPVTCGSLCLDMVSGRAFLSGIDLLLAQKEFSLLLMFVQNEGQVISAEYLYERVWGQPSFNSKGAFENMIYRLRKAIKGSGYAIMTRRGRGYAFVAK
ncbi:MAG: response regulator transcription factor [Lachnospiraceae bacterium]|jgi:DNA-binding response OmpR family regulator|nr:response regulator transcription factor [Lachnospiraceae bacterium]